MKRSTKWIIGIVVILVILVAGYFSFARKSATSSQTVTVGIMSGTSKDDKVWNEVAKIAKDKYKLNVKYKKFTDYTQPNKAVANGDVDIDAFQHYDFLSDWNKSNKGNLVPIGQTFITPIRVYSKKVKSLNDLKTGATIAVPNDATNESRALFVLKNAGLITFKPGTTQATVSSIAKNPKKIKIKELDASQTARALSDVDAAVINTNFAQTAGLNYKSAIYVEPLNKDSKKWINIVAAEKKDKNKKAYKEYVKAFQTKKVKNLIHKEYGNAELAAWDLKFK